MRQCVYTYAARAPIAGGTVVDEQMSFAHRYYNALVEIERRRRACIKQWRDRHLPPELVSRHAAHTAQVEAAVAAVRLKRSGEGRRADVSAELAALAAARQSRTEVARELSAARDILRHNARVTARMRWIDERAQATIRAARAACGLYWGTYLQIEDAVMQAGEPPKTHSPNTIPVPWHLRPSFRRWDGEGKVAVQLQGGLAVQDALAGDDRRLRVEVVAAGGGGWYTAQGHRVETDQQGLFIIAKNGRRVPISAKKQRVFTWLRVGSEGRDPMWARVPMVMHRPLPPEARIKWAWLLRRRRGPQVDWSVQFVVDEPDAAPKVGGRVALDVGWRRRDDGRRAGYWRGDDGRTGEIILPPEMATDIAHVDSLRSIRDVNLRMALTWTSDAVRTLRSGSPVWFVEATETVHAWRSGGRLVGLLRRWQEFSGGEALRSALRAWELQDRHLWEWEASRRDSILRRRREIYRITVAQLAREYAMLVIGSYNKTSTAREVPVEDGPRTEGRQQRRNQRLASPSELVGVACNAMAREGGKVLTVSDVNMTKQCARCGLIEEWDAARSLWHTCTGCSTRWDQDDNHCRNLLASALVMSQIGEPLAPSKEAAISPARGRAAMRRSGAARRAGT